MKHVKLIAVAILMFAFVAGAQGQDTSLHDTEFTLDAVFQRNQTEIGVPSGDTFKFKKGSDAFGVRGGMVQFFGGKGRRGNLGIGGEASASFSTASGDTVKTFYGQLIGKVQANGAKRFQSFATVGVGGMKRNLKQTSVVIGPGGGVQFGSPPASLMFSGSVGFAIPFSEGSRRKFNVRAQYLNERKAFKPHNVELSVGFSL